MVLTDSVDLQSVQYNNTFLTPGTILWDYYNQLIGNNITGLGLDHCGCKIGAHPHSLLSHRYPHSVITGIKRVYNNFSLKLLANANLTYGSRALYGYNKRLLLSKPCCDSNHQYTFYTSVTYSLTAVDEFINYGDVKYLECGKL